jgi:hypothetical protein
MTGDVVTKICAICEDRWQPRLFGELDGDPYKICPNCRYIGPNAPAKYDIPLGTPRPFYAHNREYIVVSEDEMRRLYQEFYDQADMQKRIREKSGETRLNSRAVLDRVMRQFRAPRPVNIYDHLNKPPTKFTKYEGIAFDLYNKFLGHLSRSKR